MVLVVVYEIKFRIVEIGGCMAKDVIVERFDTGVALVKLNRGKTRNALDTEMRRAIANAFIELEEDTSIRAVVLTGEDNFAAGADLNEMRNVNSSEMYLRHTERYWMAVANFKKPVISAINGFALGGGCELALLTDIIIVGKSAKIGQPEVNVGIMPGAGGTQRLIRSIGKSKTMSLIFTGEIISGEKAERIGIASEVVEDNETIPRAIEIAELIATKPPIAIEQIKEVTLMGMDLPLDAALALERKACQILMGSKDQIEGVEAFFAKRKPQFKGE